MLCLRQVADGNHPLVQTILYMFSAGHCDTPAVIFPTPITTDYHSKRVSLVLNSNARYARFYVAVTVFGSYS
jgi:hypothetical protein